MFAEPPSIISYFIEPNELTHECRAKSYGVDKATCLAAAKSLL